MKINKENIESFYLNSEKKLNDLIIILLLKYWTINIKKVNLLKSKIV